MPAAALLPAFKSVALPADSNMIYELRIYHCYQGKLPELLKRFREHTLTLFEKHHMKSVAYWIPTDEPARSNTLYYMLGHASLEAAKANWDEFRADPQWQAVQKASEANGKFVEKLESTYMTLTDFSPALR